MKSCQNILKQGDPSLAFDRSETRKLTNSRFLLLRTGAGSSLTIVVGGAAESLSARPGTADLTLKRRMGFIKLAMRQGADLVPVFSFGENDVGSPRSSVAANEADCGFSCADLRTAVERARYQALQVAEAIPGGLRLHPACALSSLSSLLSAFSAPLTINSLRSDLLRPRSFQLCASCPAPRFLGSALISLPLQTTSAFSPIVTRLSRSSVVLFASPRLTTRPCHRWRRCRLSTSSS